MNRMDLEDWSHVELYDGLGGGSSDSSRIRSSRGRRRSHRLELKTLARPPLRPA